MREKNTTPARILLDIYENGTYLVITIQREGMRNYQASISSCGTNAQERKILETGYIFGRRKFAKNFLMSVLNLSRDTFFNMYTIMSHRHNLEAGIHRRCSFDFRMVKREESLTKRMIEYIDQSFEEQFSSNKGEEYWKVHVNSFSVKAS